LSIEQIRRVSFLSSCDQIVVEPISIM